MAIKVIITRRFTAEKEAQAQPLINELRKGALQQAGYISGENLVNLADPEEHIVISTWSTLEQWNDWLNDARRQELQAELEQILGCETKYQIFHHG